jgi:Peptidase family M28
MRVVCTTLFFIIILFLKSSFSQSTDTVAVRYSSYIDSTNLSRHLLVLVSDSLAGRETASPGFLRSAEYVTHIFDSIQLKKLVSGSFYQEFPLVRIGKSRMAIKSHSKDYKGLLDFYSYGGFGENDLSDSEISFVGYGINDSLWNDYDNIDVDGNILMILEGEPDLKNNKNFKTNYRGARGLKKKLAIAEKNNAGAVFFILKDFSKHNQYAKKVIADGSKLFLEGSRKTPFFYISEDMANDLLKPERTTLKKIQKKVYKNNEPLSFIIERNISVSTSDKEAYTGCRNILGFLEGTDKKDEVIVVTAHLDHLGIHEGEIFYGADDNASGSAAVISMAEIFSKAAAEDHRPRRSILFMLVSGEEKGLLGSKYYTMNPVVPLEQTMVNLNVDMVGRTDTNHVKGSSYVYLIGADRISRDLHEVSEAVNNNYTQLELDYTYNDIKHPLKLYRRSDHYNFAKKGIPVIFYFSGLHEDYHQSTDTPDKIEYDIYSSRTKLLFFTLWELANREESIEPDISE